MLQSIVSGRLYVYGPRTLRVENFHFFVLLWLVVKIFIGYIIKIYKIELNGKDVKKKKLCNTHKCKYIVWEVPITV